MAIKTVPAPQAAGQPVSPIIVDLGKAKKKDIRRLKRGEGKLVDELDAVVEQVRASLQGAEGKEIVPVVVLWREKKRKRAFGPLGF